MTYSKDRAWSDQKLPTIRQIVGPLLLEPAQFELDAQQATDLIILNARDKRIAARVRRAGYADQYPFDFTLRSSRLSGVKTELQKIVEGFGDWLFYGHSGNDADASITRWYVLDLAIFRANLINREDCLLWNSRVNRDGQTEFVAFDVRSFTPDVLVASSHAVEFFPGAQAA